MGSIIAGALAAYLIGSFPTGLLVGKLFFGRDPREGGSGATGATNVFRQFGRTAGIAVSLIDMVKGALAVLVSGWVGGAAAGAAAPGWAAPATQIAAVLCAVAGHSYPVFAGFRGGKGVATGAGALLMIAPGAALLSALGFALMLGLTGIVSASSLTAALVFPVGVLLGAAGKPPSPWIAGVSITLTGFVFFTHRKNIRRLLRGEEESFGRLRFLRKKKS